MLLALNMSYINLLIPIFRTTETFNGEKLEPYSIIQELAKSLVQVGKMVEPKYLNPPLGT